MKDAIVVHVFDCDTPDQNFCIGIITKKNKSSYWIKYPVDDTEVQHSLLEKHYLNYWAFCKLSKTAAEMNDELGQSQAAMADA